MFFLIVTNQGSWCPRFASAPTATPPASHRGVRPADLSNTHLGEAQAAIEEIHPGIDVQKRSYIRAPRVLLRVVYLLTSPVPRRGSLVFRDDRAKTADLQRMERAAVYMSLLRAVPAWEGAPCSRTASRLPACGSWPCEPSTRTRCLIRSCALSRMGRTRRSGSMRQPSMVVIVSCSACTARHVTPGTSTRRPPSVPNWTG
jgi:hypothetical protein